MTAREAYKKGWRCLTEVEQDGGALPEPGRVAALARVVAELALRDAVDGEQQRDGVHRAARRPLVQRVLAVVLHESPLPVEAPAAGGDVYCRLRVDGTAQLHLPVQGARQPRVGHKRRDADRQVLVRRV